MKAIVRSANIIPCITATRISRARKGMGTMKAASFAMVPSTLSPAEMLPYRRKEKVTNLMNSRRNSSRPTKRSGPRENHRFK